MLHNIFYFSHLNVIGGIEQFFAYLAEKYKEKDITIIYKTGSIGQINRLSKFVRVIKYNGEEIHCKKAFFCFNADIRDKIIADEYILILHGDYKAMIEQGQLPPDCYILSQKFDRYIGVSKTVCDSWKEITRQDCELSYNPIIKKPIKKLLRLVYCGRLTDEKGGKLTQELLNNLDKRQVDYQLFVYSDKKPFANNNVFYLDTRLDASQFLNKQNYDYILVPSKNEGYCYSLVQALYNGLPAVVTPCPVFKELGVTDENSITLNFNGDNCNEVIDKMLTVQFNFTYTPKKDDWNKLLGNSKTTYDTNPISIKAVMDYFDLYMNKQITANDVYSVLPERAKQIIDARLAIYI